jgi:D-aminoacyl-tRNA deacylase
MRALVQRVSSARVTVDGAVTGEIASGLLVLVCAMKGDTEKESEWLARKIVNLRIFRDDQDRMNRSLVALAAETKGNRPGFSTAAPPQEGKRLYEHFSVQVSTLGVAVANGVFGADMRVELANDGPVTIWLDTAAG